MLIPLHPIWNKRCCYRNCSYFHSTIDVEKIWFISFLLSMAAFSVVGFSPHRFLLPEARSWRSWSVPKESVLIVFLLLFSLRIVLSGVENRGLEALLFSASMVALVKASLLVDVSTVNSIFCDGLSHGWQPWSVVIVVLVGPQLKVRVWVFISFVDRGYPWVVNHLRGVEYVAIFRLVHSNYNG